jgi:hypothetical protein
MSKRVNLELVGLDGNAFSLMGAFQRQARREGWDKEEIDEVLNECMSGNYNHLVATLAEHCNGDDEQLAGCDEDKEDGE